MAERSRKTTKKRTASKASGKETGKKAGPRAVRKATEARGAKAPARSKAGGESPAERIDRAIAELGDWRGERLAEVRRLIHEVDPDVVEDWKWMGSPVWSHGGMYLVADAHKDKVKLTFCHGARLPDPDRLFNAGFGGNTRRAIDLRKEDRIDREALATLLREAVAYCTANAVPKSKGSRL